MEFSNLKSIYQQIADQVQDRIVTDEWAQGERIPPMRELAVHLGVNPNTVARSYQSLLEAMIIENRRGIGYFVMVDAKGKIMERLKKRFIGEELPRLFETMDKIGIEIEELSKYYKDYISSQKRGKK